MAKNAAQLNYLRPRNLKISGLCIHAVHPLPNFLQRVNHYIFFVIHALYIRLPDLFTHRFLRHSNAPNAECAAKGAAGGVESGFLGNQLVMTCRCQKKTERHSIEPRDGVLGKPARKAQENILSGFHGVKRNSWRPEGLNFLSRKAVLGRGLVTGIVIPHPMRSYGNWDEGCQTDRWPPLSPT